MKEELILQLRWCDFTELEYGAAKADDPYVIPVKNEEPFKGRRSLMRLHGPVKPAIGRVKERTMGTDCPAFLGVNEFDIEKIGSG